MKTHEMQEVTMTRFFEYCRKEVFGSRYPEQQMDGCIGLHGRKEEGCGFNSRPGVFILKFYLVFSADQFRQFDPMEGFSGGGGWGGG